MLFSTKIAIIGFCCKFFVDFLLIFFRTVRIVRTIRTITMSGITALSVAILIVSKVSQVSIVLIVNQQKKSEPPAWEALRSFIFGGS